MSDEEEDCQDKARRPRGWLAKDVLQVVEKLVSGEVKLDKPATPHRVAKLVKELDSLDEAPSSGAVSAVFKRWRDFGFAEFHDKPFSFKCITPEGLELGLDGIMDRRAKQRKAEREQAQAG